MFSAAMVCTCVNSEHFEYLEESYDSRAKPMLSMFNMKNNL